MSYGDYVEQLTYLRTNMHFTLKTSPLTRADLNEFADLYLSGNRHQRQATWSPENPEGRWRAYSYDELVRATKPAWTSSGSRTIPWPTATTCPRRV